MKNSNTKSAYESFWNPKKKPTNRIVMFEPVKVKQLSNSPRMIKPTANVFRMKNMSTKIKVPVKRIVNTNKIKIVNDNINIPKKQMNWIQAKNKFKKLNHFGDDDKDGLMNYLDCKPFDKKRKDEFSDVYEKEWNAADIGKLSKAEKMLTKKLRRQTLIPKGMTRNDYEYYSTLTPEDLDGEEVMGVVPLKTRTGTVYVKPELARQPTVKEALNVMFPKNAPTKVPKKIISGEVRIPTLIGRTTKREKRKLESIRYAQKELENKEAPSPIIKTQSPSAKNTKDVSMDMTINMPIQTKIPTKKDDKFELIVPGQTWRYNTKAELDKGKKKYIEKMSRLQKRVTKNVMIKDNNDLELLSAKPAPKIMTQERTEVPKEEGVKVRKGRLSYSLTEGLIGLNVSKIARETGADPLTVANVLRKEITIEKIGKDLRENTAIEAKDIVEEKAQKVLKYFEERVPQKPPQTIQEIEKKLRDIKTIKGYAKLASFSPFLGTEKEAELKTITEKEVPLLSQIAALKKEEREKARPPKKEPEKEKFKMKNGMRIIPRSEMTEEEKRYMRKLDEPGVEFFEGDDYFVPKSRETKEEQVEEPEEESEAGRLVEEVSREIDESKTAEELLEEVSDEKEK